MVQLKHNFKKLMENVYYKKNMYGFFFHPNKLISFFCEHFEVPSLDGGNTILNIGVSARQGFRYLLGIWECDPIGKGDYYSQISVFQLWFSFFSLN